MTSLADLPSPHPKRLPNSTEIRQCKVAIAELDQNMQNILSQIQKLEEQLEDLAQKRANYASYIASFRRLPVEILSEIVVLSLQNGTSIKNSTSIHSSLRNAILGMPSLWRLIRLLRNMGHELPFVYDIWDKTVSCSTREQLDVILSRTGSVPLRLKLYGPVKDGTLELLSSRRSLIESLTSVYYDPWILPTHRFLGLNFSTLRELHINDYLDDIQVLMNMALQSTRDDFELYLSLERSGSKVAFFTHQLMQRITLLQISFVQMDEDDPNWGIETLDKVSLPRVKQCILDSRIELLGIFDLSNVENLQFRGAEDLRDFQHDPPPFQSLMTTPPPSQLVELVLVDVVLDFLTTLPYCLPNLAKLTLRDVRLYASLRNYFELPKLKRLDLSWIFCVPSWLRTSAFPLFEKIFFRNILELEEWLVFDIAEIDDVLVECLRSRSSLKRLATPIEHITFTGHYSWPPPTHHIVNFNFNFLCKLQIDYSFPDIPAIMGLALKSTRNHLELYLEMGRADLVVPIFTHPLLQLLALFKLYLVPDSDDHLGVIQNLNTIPLPRLKKLQFATEPALLALFDLRSVEILEVESYLSVLDLQEEPLPPDSIMTSPPPTHLIQLKLICIILDFATNQPYRFPNLVKLTLCEVGLRAPFWDYIEAPNLKELSLSLVMFESPNGGLLVSAPPVFDTRFFQSLPVLKDLFLAKMIDIEDAVVDSLRFWSCLQMLMIGNGSFNKFMSSFITGVKDQSFLPSLTHLSIRESWGPQLTMSYNDFRERCQDQRPRLDIQGEDLIQRLPPLLSRRI